MDDVTLSQDGEGIGRFLASARWVFLAKVEGLEMDLLTVTAADSCAMTLGSYINSKPACSSGANSIMCVDPMMPMTSTLA